MQSDRRVFLAGALCGAVAMGTLMAGAGVLALGGAEHVAVQAQGGAAKSTSKVVFENDRVRVKDVTFPAGIVDAGMHTHALPHVGVILTKGALSFTEPGKAAQTVQFDAGSVGYREANVTHQVGNPGTGSMRVIEVELK